MQNFPKLKKLLKSTSKQRSYSDLKTNTKWSIWSLVHWFDNKDYWILHEPPDVWPAFWRVSSGSTHIKPIYKWKCVSFSCRYCLQKSGLGVPSRSSNDLKRHTKLFPKILKSGEIITRLLPESRQKMSDFIRDFFWWKVTYGYRTYPKISVVAPIIQH